jgi:hypothetical protein
MTSKVFPVVLCLALGACAPSAEQKKSVEAVLKERLAAKALFGAPRNPQQFQTNSLAFVQALKTINASRCPADFREAWSDYVAIVERSSARFLSLVTTNSPGAGSASVPAVSTNLPVPASPTPALLLRETAPSNNAERLAELERRILAFQRDIDIAWTALKRAANRCGVEPER